MRRTAGILIWALLLTSGTGCITTVRQAMMKDSWQNLQENKSTRPKTEEPDEQVTEDCPPGQIRYEDCRTFPCKVTCEDPEDTKR
jgi:hypothetical protein